MLDLQQICADPKGVGERLADRGASPDQVHAIARLAGRRKELLADVEQLKRERNATAVRG